MAACSESGVSTPRKRCAGRAPRPSRRRAAASPTNGVLERRVGRHPRPPSAGPGRRPSRRPRPGRGPGSRAGGRRRRGRWRSRGPSASIARRASASGRVERDDRRLLEVVGVDVGDLEALERRGRRRRSRRRTAWPGRPGAPAGVSYCSSTPPCRRIAMRSPSFTASSMSWVTNTIVLRTSACRRRNSSCSRSRVMGSMAPNGSSMSSTGGSAASARATPTRWRWPPESWPGSGRGTRRGRGRRARAARRPAARIRASVPAEQAGHGGDVVGDRLVREQADLLDHVADAAAQLHRVDAG